LLCSDGLSSELEDAEILACCNTAATLEELVSQLVGAANAAGGRDNISCLVLAPALAARALPADKPGLLGQWLAAWRNL
jgi:protein phosphatase